MQSALLVNRIDRSSSAALKSATTASPVAAATARTQTGRRGRLMATQHPRMVGPSSPP